MLPFYCKRSLSISMKLFVTSGVTRTMLILIVVLCLWIAIFWASILP